jgi:hypothetical protein
MEISPRLRELSMLVCMLPSSICSMVLLTPRG